MRHNLPVPSEQSIEGPNDQLTEPPTRRWRCPAAIRAESLVLAAVGVAVALVFLPLWFAIPVALALTVVYAGIAVAGSAVTVDRRAGLLVLRVGLLTRRVRLADVSAVLADTGKVSIARAAGGEVSMSVWGNSRLHRWLRVPDESADVGHAIASAVALAQDNRAQDNRAQDNRAQDNRARDAVSQAPVTPARAGRPAGRRSTLAAALLGLSGLIAVVAALLVRVHWHNPVMTVLAVILALVLGVCGLLYLLLALWILLTGRPARRQGREPADREPADRQPTDREPADRKRAGRPGTAG
jgi:hypothetical protein